MKAIAYIGVLSICLLTGCNKNAKIFAPPPSGKSVAIITAPDERGINNLAIDATGYAFGMDEGTEIIKFVGASGTTAAVRVEAIAKTTDFKGILKKLREDEQFADYRIFYIEEGSSTRLEF